MGQPDIPIDPNVLHIGSAICQEICAARKQFAINRRSIKIHHANDAAHLCFSVLGPQAAPPARVDNNQVNCINILNPIVVALDAGRRGRLRSQDDDASFLSPLSLQKYQLTIEYRSPDCTASTSCINSDRNATTFPVSPCTRIGPAALQTSSVPPVYLIVSSFRK